MALAGQTDTRLGMPPSSALPRLPGAWTESVGIPAVPLCRETKMMSSGEKLSVMYCAQMVSSLR